MKSFAELRESRSVMMEALTVEEHKTHLEITPKGFQKPSHEGTVISNRKKPEIYGEHGPAAVDKEIRENLKSPEKNPVLKNADQYTKREHGKPYVHNDKQPVSSLRRQYAIGQAYDLATTKHPEYQKAVFEDYKKNKPEIIRQTKAKDYDSLVQRSYQHVAHETAKQFHHMPVKTQYHDGSMNYHNSGEMLRDIHAHHNLTVFRGGDKHEFLHNVDKKTGLNDNEMFRAVHDYYGHGVHGNQFGPKGEEIAWHSHHKMYSEGAHPAMTSETRGQNSYVNYSHANLDNMATMEKHRKAKREALAAGDTKGANYHDTMTRKAGENWNYAKQASVALPSAMLHPHFDGKMPEHVAHLFHDPAAKESKGVYDVDKDHLKLAKLAKHHNTVSHAALKDGGKFDAENAHGDLKHIAKIHGYNRLSRNPFKEDQNG